MDIYLLICKQSKLTNAPTLVTKTSTDMTDTVVCLHICMYTHMHNILHTYTACVGKIFDYYLHWSISILEAFMSSANPHSGQEGNTCRRGLKAKCHWKIFAFENLSRLKYVNWERFLCLPETNLSCSLHKCSWTILPMESTCEVMFIAATYSVKSISKYVQKDLVFDKCRCPTYSLSLSDALSKSEKRWTWEGDISEM